MMDFATSRIELDNQEFNLTIKDKKGAENVVADHLSRLTNESSIETTPINDSFPDKFLFSINKMA